MARIRPPHRPGTTRGGTWGARPYFLGMIRSATIGCAGIFLALAAVAAEPSSAGDRVRVYTNAEVESLEPLPTSSVRVESPRRSLPVTDLTRWAVVVGAWPGAPVPRALVVPASEDRGSTFTDRTRPRRRPRRYRPTVVTFP